MFEIIDGSERAIKLDKRCLRDMEHQWESLFSIWAEHIGDGQELFDGLLKNSYPEKAFLPYKYSEGATAAHLIEMMFPDKYHKLPDGVIFYDYNPHCWLGETLAFYVWTYGRNIREILENCSYNELLSKYYPLHEASPTKRVNTLEQFMRNKGLPPKEVVNPLQ